MIFDGLSDLHFDDGFLPLGGTTTEDPISLRHGEGRYSLT